MKFLTAAILSTVLVISFGCRKEVSQDNKPLVVVSIFPLSEAASNIAGDRARILNIMPSGTDPHTFEPPPSAAIKLKSADICVIISDHFDGWMKKYLSDSARIVYLDGGSRNPHIWLYPPDMITHLEKIKNALIEVSPEDRTYFEKNFKKYSAELNNLDRSIRQTFLQFNNPPVIQWHQAWDNFAAGYGITIVSTIEKGHASHPGLKSISSSIASAGKTGARVVIIDPRGGKEAASTFIKAVNGVPALLDPIGGSSDSKTYISLMTKNANTLADALIKTEKR